MYIEEKLKGQTSEKRKTISILRNEKYITDEKNGFPSINGNVEESFAMIVYLVKNK